MATDVGATNPSSQVTTYGYDNNGNNTSVIDPLSNQTTKGYDALNRIATVIDPANQGPPGLNTTFAYNALNEVTVALSPRLVPTGYSYNGFGDLLQTSSQDTGPTTRTFDLAGNVATSEDANGYTTTYTYDALNRRKTATYADATISNYYYDTQINAIGRLKQISDPTPAGLSSNITYFGYDIHGRVTWKQNNMTGQSYTSVYDPTLGQLTSETYPSGMVLGYLYDAAGQQKQINLNGSAFIAHVAHQPFGPAASWDWVSNFTHYGRTFDLDGRVATLPLGTDTRTMGYDNASSVTSLADTTSGVTQTIGYDANHRVTSYVGPFGGGNITGVSYDADGNRTCITSNVAGLSACSTPSTSAGTEAYAIDPSNNWINSRTKSSGTTNYTYNADGSTASEGGLGYTYDNRERVTSTNGTTSYTFNGLDEIMRRSGTGGSVRYFFGPAGKDIAGRLIGEYSATNAPYNEIIVLDGSLPVGGAPTGGTTETRDTALRIFPGHEGEPRRATDNHMNLYWTWDSDPFGVGTANNQPGSFAAFYNDTRLPGQIFLPENSNNFNYSRIYVPARGRYLQSDSIGLAGGINTYAYVGNDPANKTDPKGTCVEDACIGEAFGAIEAVEAGGGLSALEEAAMFRLNTAIAYTTNSRWLAPVGSAAWGYLLPEGTNLESPFAGTLWSKYADAAGELIAAGQEYFESLKAQRPAVVGGSCPVTPLQKTPAP